MRGAQEFEPAHDRRGGFGMSRVVCFLAAMWRTRRIWWAGLALIILIFAGTLVAEQTLHWRYVTASAVFYSASGVVIIAIIITRALAVMTKRDLSRMPASPPDRHDGAAVHASKKGCGE